MALSNLTTTYQKDYSGLRNYKGINIRVQSARARAAGPSFYDELVKIMSNEINRPATSAGREANMYDVRFCKYDLIRTKLYDYYLSGTYVKYIFNSSLISRFQE